MSAPTDRNDLIAFAKGWTRGCYRRRALTSRCEKQLGPWCETCPLNVWEEWIDPEGKPAMRPDFVSTLEGVSGMLRKLNEHAADTQYWVWGVNCRGLVAAPQNAYYCARHGVGLHGMYFASFWSPDNHPGDCVGEAWLSVFGKESVDASTE